MRITNVACQLFEYPIARRRGDAHNPAGRSKQNGVVVEVQTDEGPTGISIAQPSALGHLGALGELVQGQDPRSVRGLWHRAVDQFFDGGLVGAAADALSALDVALWDLKAKAHGEPLWRLLGAREPRVVAYASGGDMPLTDQQLSTFYRYMCDKGFRAAKLKIGLSVDDDLRRLEVVQRAFGSTCGRPALMVDASEYWSPKQAVRRVQELERRFDLTWVEEPVSRFDHLGLRTVRDNIRSPVAAGENLDGPMQFMPYLAHGCVDVVQVNWSMGGITGALRIAELAHAHGLPVAVGDSAGKFMAHVAAALPNHLMLEVHDVCIEEPVIDADTRVEDGHVVVGAQHGIGLTVRREDLVRHSVDVLTSGSGIGARGRRAGAGLIEVPTTTEERRIAVTGEPGP